MKIYSLIFLFFLISVKNVEAKEILGLNFCGKVTTDEIKKSFEKNNATVELEKNDEDKGEIIIISVDYKVGDLISEVEFSLYQGKLYKIRIKEGSRFASTLDAKYGIIKLEQKNTAYGIEKIFYYNIKDKDIDLSLSYGNVQVNDYQIPWSTVTYLCKPIDRVRIAENERIKKGKQLQKKEASQL